QDPLHGVVGALQQILRPTLVSPGWRELLESAQPASSGLQHELDYHLGVAQWHAGDRSQAVRSWERSAGRSPRWPALRCLAVADLQDGQTERAAERYLAAVRDARTRTPDAVAARAALAREAVPALLRAGRADDAEGVLDGLDTQTRLRGRFRLLRAQVLRAQGELALARALFDADFEVEDLREGEESLGEVWAALTDEPLPEHYDFRMRPGPGVSRARGTTPDSSAAWCR
ncbi:tetratricopeptide repeat protein, partial [Streptomyces boncukensis]|uniref:tetratricopeptide repeat protein n=1 Tax=Streptomyces boncukensis TaxID=2711219 RepID=UPI003B96F51A